MDFSCILAALLFFIGNVLKIVYFIKEHGRRINWQSLKKLDPYYIQQEWQFRIDNKPHLVATGVITALAWFFLCFPILQLVYVLNQSKRPGMTKSLWLHSGIVILTLGGAFTEWISYFIYLGVTMACELMYRDFDLQNWTNEGNDSIGFRSMEVTYFAIRGINFWVDAVEWMALFFIMTFIFVSVNRYRETNPGHFGIIWNALGLAIGVFSLLDFITEILRTVDFRVFSRLAFVYAAVNRLIFLPSWLLVLGWKLPQALADLEEKATDEQTPQQQQPGELELAVTNSEIL